MSDQGIPGYRSGAASRDAPSSLRGAARRPLDDLRVFRRYARRLPAFLAERMTPAKARAQIERHLVDREGAFIGILERSVYANPRSPYLRLLEAAGVELGDATKLVREDGLESALATLRDAGVYVALDEIKGRRPLERPGVSIEVDDRDFDNPLNAADFRALTGGSRSAPRRVSVDLDRLAHESAHHALFRVSFGLADRPFAVWRPIPPNSSGINNCLTQVKVGAPVAKWFSSYKAPLGLEALKFGTFTRSTIGIGRLHGARLRSPEHCPPERAARVARWLAARRSEGQPAMLDTQAALGVRACLAAKEEGIDISGTFFRFGGEPLSEAKAKIVGEAGCRVVCHYTMGETGRIGFACADATALDDVHFLSDKLAVVQHQKTVDATGTTVGALSYTSLLASAPKLLINVESDDYGVLEERQCGCPFGELGLSLHIHGIRSHEKLTSEGNHFLGSDLIALVDEVLPARFGGGPTDYQLVEEEVGGLTKVSVVVPPRIGEVSESEVVSTVLAFLDQKRHNRLMTEVWRVGGTLRVLRREPYRSQSPAAKILPLYVPRAG